MIVAAVAGSASCQEPSRDLPDSARIDLSEAARVLNMRRDRRGDSEIAYHARGRDLRLVFHARSRRMYANNVLVWLHAGTDRNGREWTVEGVDARLAIAPLIRPHAFMPRPRGGRRVAIDAGHGGEDPGAIGPGGTEEKNVTLDLALRTAAILLAQGVEVTLIRRRDETVSLRERVARARSARANAFVSVHLNATRNSRSSGVETYALTAADYPSTAAAEEAQPGVPANDQDALNFLLAYHLHGSLVRATNEEDSGVRRARFAVLRNAPCPAALVETGFLSHPLTERRYRQTAFRTAVAAALAEGILAYIHLPDTAPASGRIPSVLTTKSRPAQ